MTEAMPFLQKAILLSYDPRPFRQGAFSLYQVMVKSILATSPRRSGSDGIILLS